MSITINSDTYLKTINSLNKTNLKISKSLSILSTGSRINNAANDLASFSIRERMYAQILENNIAIQNTQSGLSLVQTAEAALKENNALLLKIKELILKAANGTLATSDREALSLELDELKNCISSIAKNTEFNTLKLMDGSTFFQIQIGANETHSLNISIGSMRLHDLSLDSIDVSSPNNAKIALEKVASAIDYVNSERGKLGVHENILKSRISYLEVYSENLSANESRIRDIDVVKEILNVTKNHIALHAGMSMFLQANLIPYRVLQLLNKDTSGKYKINPIKKI